MKKAWEWITQHVPQILLVIILLGVNIYIAFPPTGSLLRWYNNDDGFFYFKTAQNIIAGKGVTFDGINPTNGFHPLWMLVCIAVFAIGGNSLITPLRVIVILSGILLAGSGLLLFGAIQRHIHRWIGFLLTLILFTSWFVFDFTYSGGLESALSCFMIIWLWARAIQYRQSLGRRPRDLIWLGLIAGLTVLSRLDNIFLVGLLGIWLIFDHRNIINALLGDLLATVLLILFAAMIRGGYGLFQFYDALIAQMALVFSSSILLLYLFGFYANPSYLLIKASRFTRSLIVWLISSGILWAGSVFLYQMGVITILSKSILAVFTVFWLIYVVVLRGWITAKAMKVDGNETDRSSTWQMIVRWIVRPLAYYLPIVILLGIYFIWSYTNFHTVMPVSGQIKQWWGTLGQTIYGSPIQNARALNEYLLGKDSVFGFLYTLPLFNWIILGDRQLITWVVLGILWLITFLRKGKGTGKFAYLFALFPFAVATIIRLSYFYISGYVHMRSWYWTVETFTIFLLLAILAIEYGGSSSKGKPAQIITWVVVLVCSGWQFIQWTGTVVRVYPSTRNAVDMEEYLGVAHLLEEATPVSAVIGTPGGGSLSYFIQDRTIVNLDGLMNSKEYFDALQQFDTHKQMQDTGIQFIFANDYSIRNSLPYSRIFRDCITPISQVYGKTLYRYQCNIVRP